MARDVSDTVRDALGNVVREALKNMGDATPTKSKSGPLSGAKGLAAGMGLAAAAPLAKKGFDAVRGNGSLSPPRPTNLASKAGDRVGSKVKDAVGSKIDAAGGAGGIAKEAASGLLPGGDDSGSDAGVEGAGKGRRMPVQQSVDIAVPIETAYNQWTRFEDWPQFMHRVTRVTQVDDTTVSFATKIWGKTKEFTAKVETQRPDERIKWKVSEGITHTGVVTFHELAPRLTRIELTLDVEPGSLIEKAARGMRHIKRAVRGDLHRYKAFIEVREIETGAWRRVIEDGEVVDPHDDAYDDERDYYEIEDQREDAQGEDEQEKESGNGSGRERTQRFKRQAERTRSGGGSSRSSGSSGRSGSSSGGSRSGSRSSGSSSSSGRSRGSGSGSTGSGTRRKALSRS